MGISSVQPVSAEIASLEDSPSGEFENLGFCHVWMAVADRVENDPFHDRSHLDGSVYSLFGAEISEIGRFRPIVLQPLSGHC